VFEETLTSLKPRVVKEIRAFVGTLTDYGAETRMVVEREEIALDRSKTRSLHDRLEEVAIEEEE